MDYQVLNYLYNLCLNSSQEKVVIPSIRWFAQKFKIDKNTIFKTLNFFKTQNILLTEQGGKSFIIRKAFLFAFKNDTFLMFGQKVKRKILKAEIKKYQGRYEHYFEREFYSNDKLVSLSRDIIYTFSSLKIDVNKGVDTFLSKYIKGQKNVFKQIIVLDISNTNEYKQLQTQFCVYIDVKIYDHEGHLVSHSFSLTPVIYYQNFSIEMLL